jgi:hypothetical protein
MTEGAKTPSFLDLYGTTEEVAGKSLMTFPQELRPEIGGRNKRESPLNAKSLMPELRLRPLAHGVFP